MDKEHKTNRYEVIQESNVAGVKTVTSAMYIIGQGCLVKVTTTKKDTLIESVVFIAGSRLEYTSDSVFPTLRSIL